ncbi:hypothetical protein RJ640_000545 [Escallonia rubra]|uniref:KIB1-4 beta-propeller domain-containing protein n=1 Tax=Escallonia rubra TaxID=112253 RepID=A0AA88U9I1_9ASTE|nr:hypothetical protein RJ640_000545 [Escallonia rubra]
MEKINLPPWKLPVVQTCVITSSPTDPNCIVAFLDNEEPYITFCRPGEDRWVEQDYGTSLYEDDMLHAVTVCKGSIYVLTSRGELVRLEVWDGIFVMNKLVADIPPKVLDIAACKVEDIQVYQMDFSKEEWVRVDSLGEDRAFFVNGFGNTASCSASESGVEGNSIYFIDRDYRSLVNIMATKNVIADLVKGEKLNRDNYDVWHKKMKFMLNEQELKEHLTKEMVAPTEAQPLRDHTAYQKWNQKDRSARYTLLSSLQNDLIGQYDELPTCKAL